jgi:hypothetical protein
VKNSEHSVQLIGEINLQNGDSLVSFDTASLFTKLPAEAVLQVATNGLTINPTLWNRSLLQVEEVIELVNIEILFYAHHSALSRVTDSFRPETDSPVVQTAA